MSKIVTVTIFICTIVVSINDEYMSTSEDFKKMIITPELATVRVKKWLKSYNKAEMSKLLGVERSTLYNRLKRHNWKVREIEAIEKHLPF